MKQFKEKIEKYIKLVDEAILINDEKEFEKYLQINSIHLGLCWYLSYFDKFQYIGKKIIKRNNIIIPSYLKSFNNYWFKTTKDLYNLEYKKESLLLRKQVVEYILEIYYPNSFKQLILNLWKRF